MTLAVNIAQGASNNVTFRNRIINGACVIDQRNAGASVTPNNSYTLDRWQAQNSQTSKYTVQQNAGSVTPPTGFSYYLGVTSSSAYTVLTGDYFMLVQSIEGYNFSDMAWGTSSAATVTLSFWVRSSLTGTFGGSLRNSASSRSYPFSYTISAANTWEQKSITITGDTTGTWIGATNGIGVNVFFGLGVGATFSGTAGSWSANNYVSATGATSVVGTSGATFYITGVQLEAGTTASPFEYRQYGTELQLCQRYYQILQGNQAVLGAGMMNSTTAIEAVYMGGVPMRAAPTVACSSSASNALQIRGNNSTSDVTGSTFSASWIASPPQAVSFRFNATANVASFGSGQGCVIATQTGAITLNGEL